MAGVDTTGNLSDPPQHHDDIGAGATGCDRDCASSSAAIPTSQLRHCYEYIDGKINQQQETMKPNHTVDTLCSTLRGRDRGGRCALSVVTYRAIKP
jgi:hypothetical protein